MNIPSISNRKHFPLIFKLIINARHFQMVKIPPTYFRIDEITLIFKLKNLPLISILIAHALFFKSQAIKTLLFSNRKNFPYIFKGQDFK